MCHWIINCFLLVLTHIFTINLIYFPLAFSSPWYLLFHSASELFDIRKKRMSKFVTLSMVNIRSWRKFNDFSTDFVKFQRLLEDRGILPTKLIECANPAFIK